MTQAEESGETTWRPAVGDRVVLLSPPEWVDKATPAARYATVYAVHDDGSFDVELRPNMQTHRVIPEEYARHGASWRAWRRSDSWPGERHYSRRGKDDKKKGRR